ncbi:MAG: peptidylprolyl isomerase [Pseudolabrys sp.]|jgi:hypothetical protein
MIKRLAALLVLGLLGLSLGGCSKCGFIWETGPKSCHSDETR